MALSVRTEKPESDYAREMTFSDRKGAQPLVSGQFLGLSEACESSAPLLPVHLDPHIQNLPEIMLFCPCHDLRASNLIGLLSMSGNSFSREVDTVSLPPIFSKICKYSGTLVLELDSFWKAV